MRLLAQDDLTSAQRAQIEATIELNRIQLDIETGRISEAEAQVSREIALMQSASEQRRAIREAERAEVEAGYRSIDAAARSLAQFEASGAASAAAAGLSHVAKNFRAIKSGSADAVLRGEGTQTVAAGFIRDTTAQALVAGAFELAAGFAALAVPGMQWAAALHFTSAGLYAAIAGMSLGGSSAGSGASASGPIRAPSSGTGGGGGGGQDQVNTADPTGPSTVIYNYGPTVGTSQEAATGLAQTVALAAGTGFAGSSGAL